MRQIIHAGMCALALAILASCNNTPSQHTMITKSPFGVLPDGRDVYQFEMKNPAGASVTVITYGATVTRLTVPDRAGHFADVVLGYDSLRGYLGDKSYFGAIVGRYGNRIGKGRFTLDGHTYQLSVNDGENHLHGGTGGFNTVLWEVTAVHDSAVPSLTLTYLSPDGEQGYPGTVKLAVTYTLTEANALRIDYEGSTDKATPLNPTHHSYFNLTGSPANTILNHTLQIEADSMTPVGPGLITTGAIIPVAGTPLDFRSPVAIGAHISDANEQLALGLGYDHNWVLRNFTGAVRPVATLYDSSSGRVLTVLTDQPGLQFYSGNFLDGSVTGKGGIRYAHRTGLCLEAQRYPDSPNKPDFPSSIVRPGETYRQTTIYQFSTK